MDRKAALVYGDAVAHGAVSDLIRRHSSNRRDVRRVALRGLDLGGPVLDLGCGFGFMAEGVAQASPPGTEIVGIDVEGANRDPFLARVRAAGCRGSFREGALATQLEYPDRAFHTVTASYSLYFFPGIVPEVARVTASDGRFVVLTHCESSLRSLLCLLGLPAEDAPEIALLHACSAETGASLLTPHFASLEERPHRNSLVFAAQDTGALLAYLRFKLPLIAAGCRPGSDLPGEVVSRVADLMRTAGRIVIPKDDAIFVCTDPVGS